MFNNSDVNYEILKKRAYNLRWATVPNGVIPLTAADPDFPCAPEITTAIEKYIKDRYLSYGPADGLPIFKESMSNYFTNKRNIETSPDLLFPVDSAAFGIYITCKAFLSSGDEAIIFDPVDFLFRYSIEAVGGTAVTFPIPADQISIDFEQLESIITSKTKLLCICNPLNPTGKVFTKEELKQLGEIANRNNLVILSDEIWSDIIYPPHVYTSIASISKETKDRTVTITGFSKSYALAGLRIGAVVAPNALYYKKLIEASMHHSTIHGVNVLGQIAASAALTDCEYWLNGFIKHLTRMRNLCVNELNSISGFKCIAPEGTYVAFADITATNKTSEEVSAFLLEKAKVAVVPGLKKWFGEKAEGYIRISFATSESVLTDALTRIQSNIKFL